MESSNLSFVNGGDTGLSSAENERTSLGLGSVVEIKSQDKSSIY